MMESYGKITVAYGSDKQRELEVLDFVQAKYIDNRTVSVSSIEDGTNSITVENNISTGRAPQQSIWLSKDSFKALLSTIFLYLQVKGINISEDLKDCIEGNTLNYKFSDNLKPITNEDLKSKN